MIVTKITISYFKHSCNDIKVYKNRTSIEDRRDQRRCHDRRIKPYLLRHERKDTPYAFRHCHNSDHRYSERCRQHQISVIHNTYPDAVDNGEESPNDKRYSDFLKYNLKYIRKFNFPYRKPADDKC